MKYLLLLIPLTVFAGDNYNKCCNQTIINEYTEVTNEYTNEFLDYKKYDSALAISAAMASIPDISHAKHSDGHLAIGYGIGVYDGETAIALGLEKHLDDTALKLNIGINHKETMVGAGASFSID